MRAEQQTDYSCLVCIIGSSAAQPKHIYYYSNENVQKLFQDLETEADVRLLYYRQFTNTFDALAHKLLIETLSKVSVNYNITLANKKWEDLQDQLKCELGLQVNK